MLEKLNLSLIKQPGNELSSRLMMETIICCLKAHGRVHGFLIDEIFYIVWLDPEHLLYPAKG
jgi:hypothetical protein